MILAAQDIVSTLVRAGPKDPTTPAGVFRHMVEPFNKRKIKGGMTGGLSGCGYDVHIAQTIWLWPFWGRIASTIEHFHIPTNIRPEMCNKSSLARRFIWQPNTTAEPGWRGNLTLELVRMRPWPVRIKKGTPIAQVIFHVLTDHTTLPYTGRYQDQGAAPQKAIPATSENTFDDNRSYASTVDSVRNRSH
jgi:dCTP deaminase